MSNIKSDLEDISERMAQTKNLVEMILEDIQKLKANDEKKKYLSFRLTDIMRTLKASIIDTGVLVEYLSTKEFPRHFNGKQFRELTENEKYFYCQSIYLAKEGINLEAL